MWDKAPSKVVAFLEVSEGTVREISRFDAFQKYDRCVSFYDLFRFGHLEIVNNLQASLQLTMKIQPLTVLA
jgi:hypothetical protein